MRCHRRSYTSARPRLSAGLATGDAVRGNLDGAGFLPSGTVQNKIYSREIILERPVVLPCRRSAISHPSPALFRHLTPLPQTAVPSRLPMPVHVWICKQRIELMWCLRRSNEAERKCGRGRTEVRARQGGSGLDSDINLSGSQLGMIRVEWLRGIPADVLYAHRSWTDLLCWFNYSLSPLIEWLRCIKQRQSVTWFHHVIQISRDHTQWSIYINHLRANRLLRASSGCHKNDSIVNNKSMWVHYINGS